jgi:hypothetical protein
MILYCFMNGQYKSGVILQEYELFSTEVKPV